ncbi:MAG: aromatic compound degradation protein PaaI, partial [Nocardioides sp.]|nr:aromatic compound degradation protein PaaI [Nocardioides sp.]
GRTMASYEVVITDERGKRVCTTRITCALMPRERYAG